MNNRFIYACVMSFIQIGIPTVSHAQSAVVDSEILCAVSWKYEIDSRLGIQAPPNTVSISNRDKFPEPMLRISIRKSDNYSGVANGTPRGEISFSKIFRFSTDNLYEIKWSTATSDDYKFDYQQPELFTQILQGEKGGLGPPPFSIRFVDGNYEVEIRNAQKAQPKVFVFGDPLADRGKVVRWKLRYRPDYTGRNAVTELFMNGKRVVDCSGCGNAYEKNDDSYLKVGIYKWWWQARPSDVTERTLYFGTIEVTRYLSM